MSVTVSDLLKLPSLRQAKVIGGAGGLQKVVSSISVLESADPAVLINEVFSHEKYSGGEIVITGFLNCVNDIDRQCSNLLRLIDGGEVGLVLYYVGVYLPFPAEENGRPCPFLSDAEMFCIPIRSDLAQPFQLTLIKVGAPLSPQLTEQAADTVRICINIWGKQHGAVAIHELVRAILQDEPLKMRRLAEIFHVDVASLHELWML